MIQLFIFVVIKLLITLVFRNNPGSVVQFHLFDHNLQLLNFYTVTDILIFVVSVLLIALLAGLKWSEKPAVIKYGLWIIVPLIVLAMLFGFVEELRDYYEVYPILLILVVHSIYRLCGIKLMKIETQPAQ